MKWFKPRAAQPADTLYAELVGVARQPKWYTTGAVPDTVDGRFDMVAGLLALLLLRLERPDTKDAAAQYSVDLTERFIADMDGSLRQLGMGDPTVGKQVGHMVAALGGRLGAYRDALDGGDLRDAVARNLYRGATVDDAALDWTAREFSGLHARLDEVPLATLAAGSFGAAA